MLYGKICRGLSISSHYTCRLTNRLPVQTNGNFDVEFVLAHTFRLGANMHDGGLVVCREADVRPNVKDSSGVDFKSNRLPDSSTHQDRTPIPAPVVLCFANR